MMEEYFQTRDTLKITVLITDIRHQPTKDDLQMYAYLKHLHIPVLIIATKLDKVAKNKKATYLNRTKECINLGANDHSVTLSAETCLRKEAAWNVLKGYLA